MSGSPIAASTWTVLIRSFVRWGNGVGPSISVGCGGGTTLSGGGGIGKWVEQPGIGEVWVESVYQVTGYASGPIES